MCDHEFEYMIRKCEIRVSDHKCDCILGWLGIPHSVWVELFYCGFGYDRMV